MKEEWFTLYESMMREMEDARKTSSDFKTEIETCFNIAQSYWGRIQNKLEEFRFESPRDEIEFYKTVKPLFKSHIEFYNLIYHAELFKPVGRLGEMKEFWIKEQQRLDKFIQDNSAFYTYHKTGATNRDKEYFLSLGNSDITGKKIYFDDLIVTLLALERYMQYIKSELTRR